MAEMKGPSSYPWPPTLFAIILLVSGALSIIVPQNFLPVINSWLWPVAGILIIIGAQICGISAQCQFRKANTSVNPTQPVAHFVETGIYRFSRNPMYLCGCLTLSGFAIAVNSLWILLGLPVFVIMVWRLGIKREEHYLNDRFGETYKNYKKRVPRWIGPF